MNIFPAIDLCGGKAVRLLKGDYSKMTVYGEPLEFAADFRKQGAEFIHIVDLDGARDGSCANLPTVCEIAGSCGMFSEIGGGIRSMEMVDRYLSIGVGRVILGTAAVSDRGFLKEAVRTYGERVAVGVDILDGMVMVKGWTEGSKYGCYEFCQMLQDMGVKNIICTDISKDGAMKGTNHVLYRSLSEKFDVNITASGGVSSIDDVKKLRELDIYGAIIGKAYYTGAVSLKEAIEVAK